METIYCDTCSDSHNASGMPTVTTSSFVFIACPRNLAGKLHTGPLTRKIARLHPVDYTCVSPRLKGLTSLKPKGSRSAIIPPGGVQKKPHNNPRVFNSLFCYLHAASLHILILCGDQFGVSGKGWSVEGG